MLIFTFLECVFFFFFLHSLHSSLNHLTTLHSHKKKYQNMLGLIMSSRNGSFMTFPDLFFFLNIGVSLMIVMQARAQTSTTSNFSRFYCNAGDNATDPAAFVANFNATHDALRTNLSSPAATGFATAELVRGSAPVYAIFHCRGYLTNRNCLACLDSVFAIAGANCYTKYRATIFTDGCYLRYAGTNVFEEVLNPGQSGFCDAPSPAESGDEFNATASEALVEVRREVLARNGRFVAGRKGAGAGAAVYAAGECLPILGLEDCRRCMESAVRNVEGCLPGAGGRAVESACFVRYSGEEFFNGSLAVDLDLLRPGKGAIALRLLLLSPLSFCFCRVETKIR